MKNAATGFLLAWQFFSFVPIKKQLDLNQRSMTWMYVNLPVVGFMMGAIVAGVIYGLMTYSDVSNVLLAILIVVGMIIFTGGLHLDGFLDMCDAFFSYGDKEKRLQVLDDPRTGAFGVIGFVSLVLLKFGFIYEALAQESFDTLMYIVAIPYVARLGMLVYFMTMQTSKKTGLAAYFKGQVERKSLLLLTVVILMLLSVVVWNFHVYSVFLLLMVMLLAVMLYRKWSYKQFGGMSGDLLGALGESLEVLLWGSVLLFI